MKPWRCVFLPFAAGYFLSYLLRNANAVIAPELKRGRIYADAAKICHKKRYAFDLTRCAQSYDFGYNNHKLNHDVCKSK